MADLATVALQSLAFASLDDGQRAELRELTTPDGSPIEFTPYEPAVALQVVAESLTTPRMVKLALLQEWSTGPLRQLVDRDDDSIRALATAVMAPETLHPDPPDPPDPEPLLEALDAYAGEIEGLPIPEDGDAATEYLEAAYEASASFHEATAAFISYEEGEVPAPSIVAWLSNGSICFQAHFVVSGATAKELSPMTEPLNWPGCGGGFWASVKRIDNYTDLYKEQARLRPGWYVWVNLRTARSDAEPNQYCLDYQLAASPDLAVNEGFLCVTSAGPDAAVVTMRKCLRWEDAAIQTLLVGAAKTIGLLMLQHLQGMASGCRIDAATGEAA